MPLHKIARCGDPGIEDVYAAESAYYNLLRLDRDGYTRIQQACTDTAQRLSAESAG